MRAPLTAMSRLRWLALLALVVLLMLGLYCCRP
jgi:hypothetical protein